MSDLHRNFLDILLRTERLAPERLAAYQDRLLTALVGHARATTPVYRDSPRLDVLYRSDGTLDLSRWSEVPILLRSEIRAAGTGIYAESWPDQAGPWHVWTTTGTTEAPLELRRSASLAIATACCFERNYLAHRLDGSRHLVRAIGSMRHDNEKISGWSFTRPEGQFTTIRLALSNLEPLELIRAAGGAYLDIAAGIAHEIARTVVLGGAEPVPFEAVLTFAETLRPEARSMISEAFSARVIDRYGCEEAGLIAAECPEGRYHVQSETCLVEIVDDQGRLVPPGTEGRVVITPFYNYAMPMLRYALGDRATLSPHRCACGRTLPVLEHLGGRANHQFRFPDGTVVTPFLSDHDLYRLIPFRQFQLVQEDGWQCRLKIQPIGDPPEDLSAIIAFVRSRLASQVDVTVECVPTVFRRPGAKRENYVSHAGEVWFGNPTGAPPPRLLNQPAYGPYLPADYADI